MDNIEKENDKMKRIKKWVGLGKTLRKTLILKG
jgi:hypothetical protein